MPENKFVLPRAVQNKYIDGEFETVQRERGMGKVEETVQRIEGWLVQGRWPLFARLPAERELAQELSVNRGTLRTAMHVLAGAGLLEIRHGSGIFVRNLPQSSAKKRGSLKECIEAFQLFMPPLMEASLGRISPSVALELERMLPQAGSSLRGGDIKAFISVQVQFFTTLAMAAGNPCITHVVAQIMPDGLALSRLLQKCPFSAHEALFAQLARLLNAVNRADGKDGAQAAQGYAQVLLNLV